MVLPAIVKSRDCICPKCGKIHKMKINWKGKGMPKKFCKTCKKVAERMGNLPEWR